MTAYKKVGWKDHIVDADTQEVIQEGTPLSQANFNHMDDEIERLGNELINNDLIKLTSNKTLYVVTTGNDTTGDGTSIKPFATIQKAIDNLPKNLGGYSVNINVSAGTYTGFALRRFYNGFLNIIGGTDGTTANSFIIDQQIIINSCNNHTLLIKGFKINNFFDIVNSHNVLIDTCIMNNINKSISGVTATYNSDISIVRTDISNRGKAVQCTINSRVSLWNVIGVGNDIVIDAGMSSGVSSIVTINASTITGATRYIQSYGSVIIEDGIPISVNNLFESGTWTPTLKDDMSGGTITPVANDATNISGSYSKNKNTITCSFYLMVQASNFGTSNYIQLAGLPITPKNAFQSGFVSMFRANNVKKPSLTMANLTYTNKLNLYKSDGNPLIGSDINGLEIILTGQIIYEI